MTKNEYEQVISTIEKCMTILPNYMTNLPRVVLTKYGLSMVKQELIKMVEEH